MKSIEQYIEKKGLLTSAYCICFCDLLITTLNQKTGYWTTSNTLANESNKVIQYLMMNSRLGIFVITIVYASLLFILISKLPIRISWIVGLASILMNTTGFASWIWFEYRQIYTFLTFIAVSALTISLTFPSKFQKVLIRIVLIFAVLIYFISILYALYQMHFGVISKFLNQKSLKGQFSNEEILDNDFFDEIDFRVHSPEEIESYQWPFSQQDKDSIIFTGLIDLKFFSEIILGQDQLSTESLESYFQKVLKDNHQEIETGKILFVNHPSKNKRIITLSFGSDQVSRNKDFEVDLSRTRINYYIQFSSKEDGIYYPEISFLDFNIIVQDSGVAISRYNLAVIDEMFSIIDSIAEGIQEGYITSF